MNEWKEVDLYDFDFDLIKVDDVYDDCTWGLEWCNHLPDSIYQRILFANVLIELEHATNFVPGDLWKHSLAWDEWVESYTPPFKTVVKKIGKDKERLYGNYKYIKRRKWSGTRRLYTFLCWYVTEIFELNNIRMKKNGGGIDYALFRTFFINSPNPEKNIYNEFREGLRPKFAEYIEKAVDKVLSSLSITPKKIKKT